MNRHLLQSIISFAVAGSLGLAACGPCYESLEIEGESTPPVAVVLSPTFSVPTGVAVLIHVEPVADPDKKPYDEYTRVNLVSQDPAIFRVDPTSDDRRYLLMGIAPGETCVDVEIDGYVEECILAQVPASQ